MEAAAAHNPIISGAGERSSILRNLFDIPSKHILAPLPDIPRHVMYAELIWSLSANRLGVVAVSPVVPCDGIEVVTAAEPEAISPVRPAASRIFPLRFRRKAKASSSRCNVPQHVCPHGMPIDLIQKSSIPCNFIPGRVLDR